ncbi:glutamate ABC transporter substrate-binding protein [Pseudonocardia yunnanensis]|uniref:Glutamate ABC transporter substrate-binding protein n=1 Tax=Pseudonocardia yunnanensis TaxID=58107 RepID=A0ABW4F802_9PSEU
MTGHETRSRPSSRLPLIALAVAGVLALGSLLLPDGGPSAAVPATTTGAPAAAPAPPACSEVRESLRPTGPLPAPGAMPPGSTMAAIAARGRLIAGVDQGKYLAGYRNPITGQIEGSDIDIVHRIAAAILGDPNAVQFVVLDIADRANAVRDRRVDMVVNSFTVTCARQENVEFSSAYTTVSQRMLVPVDSGVREVEDLAGQRVCTSEGSTTEDVLRALPLGLQVSTRAGIPDCVLDLQHGRVEAVSSDDVILAGLAAQDPQTEIVGRALDNSRYAVGMQPGQPDLVRFVNGVLEQARADGSLAASNQKWFAGHLDQVPPVAPAVYRD